MTVVDAREVEKTEVEFRSGGVVCRGWFYRPGDTPSPPCVVMAHGFGASPDGPLGRTAQRFAAAGLAALAFDYRHFGASDGAPRQVFRISRVLEDWEAAIAYVRARGDIDPHQIGLWGSSGSGGQVLAVAAKDHALAGVVAQVPYADGHSLARAAGVRQLLRVAPAIGRDLVRRATGQPPYLIGGIAPPTEPSAVITRYPDIYPTLVANAPGWVNKINASSLLDLWRFRPFKVAHQIRCPLLVVLVYHDLIAPEHIAMRAAHGLPYVELTVFAGRHFDLYSGETYERAVRTEIRFYDHHFNKRQATMPEQSAPRPARGRP